MFITFDGGDGCGKSTQVKLLADWFRELGRDVLPCNDPGSTSLGNAVRKIVLEHSELEICSTAEMLLFMAARTQLVDEIIRPAVAQNKVVISDRFLLSNLVYQGYGGGVCLDLLRQVGEIATFGMKPDIGFVLDLPLEIAISRMENRGRQDRMESKGIDYHERVRAGFLELAKAEPERYHIIDATESIDSVQKSIQKIVEVFTGSHIKH